ncbi:MAG: peptidylprolyl isomerase, partial [Bacteroidota bacterium]
IYFLLHLVLTAGFIAPTYAQTKQKKKKKSKALLTFDQGTVTQAEFERVYAKNNGGLEAVQSHTPDQYREYLDLYINFKRKVFAAEAQGLNDTDAFQREFNQYKKQLVQPYLSAKDVEDQLIQEAYDRSQQLVNASHLLIRVGQDALPQDTLKAYEQILGLRDSVVSGGVDFEKIAQAYSEDPSAKDNAGNLGYFSAFAMVYPFETAAFTTPVNEVSLPIRTQFGYHLVKVNDRIKNEGTKRSAHIIVRTGDRYSAKSDEQAGQIIEEIYQKLKNGEDFAALAQQYSDDPNTAERGGDLGTGRLLPAMEDIKLKLSKDDYSEPFKTPYGYHILKVTEVEGLGSFEESKAQIKQKISRDSRAQISRNALLERIKSENNYQMMEAPLSTLKSGVSAAFPRGGWQPDSTLKDLMPQVIFSLGSDYQATIKDLINYYNSKRLRFPRLSPSEAVDQVYKSFLESELLAYEEAQLPNKNEDFRNLLQEYRDGILLFTLMEQKVWKKAVQDTTGLQQYYEDNKDSFQAKERIDVREYRGADAETMAMVQSKLEAGMTDRQIDSIFNATSAINIRITSQTYEKGEAGLEDALFEQKIGHVSKPIEASSFYRVLVIEEKRPAGIKTFEEAKSECITRYQDYLEQTWLAELAEQYPVKINEKVFKKLYK